MAREHKAGGGVGPAHASAGVAAMRVCIGIATCARPEGLARLLASLARLEPPAPPRVDVRVVVVDNDASGSAAPVVARAAAKLPWPVEYVVEAERGIAQARNRINSAAGACGFVAFIDDDEEADRGWLAELVRVQRATGADAVLGHVAIVCEKRPGRWLEPLFARPRNVTGARVGWRRFRSGNLLLSTAALAGIGEPFDLAFSRTGGADSFLGRILELRGRRFVWAADAVIREFQPAHRVSARWLAGRYYQHGIIAAAMDARLPGAPARLAGRVAKGAAGVGLGLLLALPGAVLGGAVLRQSFVRFFRGLGSLAGVLGTRPSYYGSNVDAQLLGAGTASGRYSRPAARRASPSARRGARSG